MDLADTTSEKLYVNTRGLFVQGKIGQNVIFSTWFYENQSFHPSYLDDFVSQYGVMPGQGRVKNFKTTGYDYAMAFGVVNIRAANWLHIEIGNGKHFLGDGYRSLALSGNAFNYPYAQFTSWFGPFQYTNLFMGFQNLNVELPTSTVTERRFQRKIGTLHHLDWSVNSHLTVGIFEQMIWGASKSKGKFEINSDGLSFVNPVPFIRPLQYGLSDENNVLLGINTKIFLPRDLDIYGQVILDDLKKNKYGFQIGIKNRHDRDLKVRLEYNQVAPYTYGHADSTRNFAHYNQPLAHPLGAGFSELNGSFFYRFHSGRGSPNFFIAARMSYAMYDHDGTDYHWGKDIFKSDDSKSLEQILPESSELFYHSYNFGYYLNHSTGAQISVGLTMRSETTGGMRDNMRYAYVSFRTFIPERVYDF